MSSMTFVATLAFSSRVVTVFLMLWKTCCGPNPRRLRNVKVKAQIKKPLREEIVE
jgi:hypothetical protein